MGCRGSGIGGRPCGTVAHSTSTLHQDLSADAELGGPLLGHPSARRRTRSPHHAGAPGPRRREYPADLHPRLQPRAVRRHESRRPRARAVTTDLHRRRSANIPSLGFPRHRQPGRGAKYASGPPWFPPGPIPATVLRCERRRGIRATSSGELQVSEQDRRSKEPREADHTVMETASESGRLAGVVALGAGAESTPAEANGRPPLHGDRPSANARASVRLPRGCRRGSVGDRGAAPAKSLGGYPGTRLGAPTAGCRNRVPGLGLRR